MNMVKTKKSRKKKDVHKEEETRAEIVFDRVVSDDGDGDAYRKHGDVVRDYLGVLVDYPVLRDVDEFNRIFADYKQPTDAQRKKDAEARIVYGNIRLVLSIALRNRNRGLDFEDLMQEGILGMMHALDLYDPGQAKFSTYATQWIKQAIGRAIYNLGEARPFRVPVHVQELTNKVRKFSAIFYKEHERLPNVEEILAHLKVQDPENKTPVSLENVTACLDLLMHRYMPTDHSPDEDEAPKTEFVSHKAVRPLTEAMAREHLARCEEKLSAIGTVIATLEPRLRTILRLRFGLMPGLSPITLEEISERYGITRERIRQLEMRALTLLAEKGIVLNAEELP